MVGGGSGAATTPRARGLVLKMECSSCSVISGVVALCLPGRPLPCTLTGAFVLPFVVGAACASWWCERVAVEAEASGHGPGSLGRGVAGVPGVGAGGCWPPPGRGTAHPFVSGRLVI